MLSSCSFVSGQSFSFNFHLPKKATPGRPRRHKPDKADPLLQLLGRLGPLVPAFIVALFAQPQDHHASLQQAVKSCYLQLKGDHPRYRSGQRQSPSLTMSRYTAANFGATGPRICQTAIFRSGLFLCAAFRIAIEWRSIPPSKSQPSSSISITGLGLSPKSNLAR